MYYLLPQLFKVAAQLNPRMLSKELKDLEINGLILRTAYDSLPLKVTYKLADYGYSLVPLIIELTNWGKQHREKIKTATL